MNPDLERRYRLLLRTYPPGYRAEHEGEIISTLADGSQAGQRWPSFREARALLAAGIRLRALTAGGHDARGLALDGLHLGAVLLVAGNAIGAVFSSHWGPSNGWSVAWDLAWVLTFAALVRGGRLLPPVCACGAALLVVWMNHDGLVSVPIQWFSWSQVVAGSLLPAALITGLARRGPLPGRSPLLLLVPALPYAIAMGIVVSPFFMTSTFFAMLVVASAFSLLVLPLDPRPAIAVAVFLVPTLALMIVGAAQNIILWAEPSWTWPTVWLLICFTLAAAGLAGTRRLARA